MYIKTGEGLGQGQATWSTLQTFNRPMTQPTQTGYLGNFNEYMGKAGTEPCKEIWAVSEFGPNSAKLLDFQKKHIKDIATRIIRLLERDLKGTGKGAEVRVQLSFEGHVDKSTDPANFGELDLERARAVGWLFQREIVNEWNKKLVFEHPALFSNEESGVGSTRPFGDGKDSKKNRRVVICVRWWIKSTP